MTIKMVRKDNIKVQKVIELIEMHLNLLFFSILSSFPVFTFSYNYLVFCPLFAHSHHKFLAKIADTLTDAGHNVTFLAPIIVKEYEHIKYLETTKDIIYIQPDENLKQIGDSADYASFWKDDFGMFSMLPAIENNSRVSGHQDNIPILLDDSYDGTEQINREPVSPSFLPISVSPFGDQMTFKERLLNTLGDFTFTHIFKPPVLKSLKYPYNDLDINEIQSKAPFVFFNSNPFLDFPRPTLTKTIAIGGISVNVTQMRLEKLSSEYDQIMSQRKKNVLISFGSMLRSCEMPDEYKNMIIRVVEQHPEATFIWKYESEDLDFAKNVKNLHFSKWVPQTALLADSRLSAFITHAGLGSVNELSYLGKPAILIPIFADQLRNAKMLARHNGSITLERRDLGNFERLEKAVDSILNDESYQKYANRLAHQLESQPFSPHDLLVKYAEYGAKFGELPSLDPYYRKMSFFSFYMIDIFLFLFFVLISIVSVLTFSITHSGHNVTFLAPIIVEGYENIKYWKHTTDIIYIQPDEKLKELGKVIKSVEFTKYWTEELTVFSMISSIKLFQKMFFKIYENFKKDLRVLDSLKTRKFDAIIYEVFAFNAIGTKCFVMSITFENFSNSGISRYQNIVSSLFRHSQLFTEQFYWGAIFTSYTVRITGSLSPFGDKMTFEERLMNTLCSFIYGVLLRPPTMSSYKSPYHTIDLNEAESRAPFVFLNSNPYLDFPRPTLTKTVQIGGITVNRTQMKQEKLPLEFDKILEIRQKTVLISFGTIMLSKDTPEDYKINILKVIESFPNVTFIWKYESDTFEKAKNLKKSIFIQMDSSNSDSRLHVFITHAGLGSVNELSYMGKPALLVPLYADQLRNAKMERHKGAVLIDKKDLANFESLRNTFADVLNNQSYKKNAELLARQLELQPITPQELLLKHATFGVEFGELPSLDPYSRQMSFFTFFMIDVYLFLFCSFVVLFYILFVVVRFLFCWVFRQQKLKQKNI
ncbi:Protein CBG09665 [Caenorhabditis briggsae]|uniref:glucuronosyltransferase n=1 Tax=Caenorhabditis briggsae TaxID=6238 RepID=A8X8I8_CAEBR|nr:Protein CBG09665 [Caenorhabditis briggsae]CAP28949.2 Protein CBG09665 [Caenorhabditis briggsae]